MKKKKLVEDVKSMLYDIVNIKNKVDEFVSNWKYKKKKKIISKLLNLRKREKRNDLTIKC